MTVELYVVSDFTGETAEHVARAAASQFGPEAAKLVRFRYVNNEEKGLEILRTAKELNAEYFRRVKAIEFAIKCDDGRSPEFLDQAELVVIGVSRTSKTPLSMYLAHKGIAAANIPLVPEADPPQELFSLPPEKVVGLLIAPEKLVQIRKERLRVLGLDAEVSNYAQWERVQEELDFAKGIMRRTGCRTFDVTNRAIEETAQEILDCLRR